MIFPAGLCRHLTKRWVTVQVWLLTSPPPMSCMLLQSSCHGFVLDKPLQCILCTCNKDADQTCHDAGHCQIPRHACPERSV